MLLTNLRFYITSKMKEELLEFISNNSSILFKKSGDKVEYAVFDSKGFWFEPTTQNRYDQIKDEPHLYIAFDKSENGFFYVGKSFQKGGRWKRSHAYHLGTLAHHLLDTLRYDDQNHQHWIDAWMDAQSKDIINNNLYKIRLKQEVYITFIPFKLYSNIDFYNLQPKEIKSHNHHAEGQIIDWFLTLSKNLLNVQRNSNAKNNNPRKESKTVVEPSAKRTSDTKTALSKDCFSFDVKVNENGPNIADGNANLPTGACILTFRNTDTGEIVYQRPRTIRTEGRTVGDYLRAPDTSSAGANRPKWQVIQIEMRDNRIKQITITVCSIFGKK